MASEADSNRPCDHQKFQQNHKRHKEFKESQHNKLNKLKKQIFTTMERNWESSDDTWCQWNIYNKLLALMINLKFVYFKVELYKFW